MLAESDGRAALGKQPEHRLSYLPRRNVYQPDKQTANVISFLSCGSPQSWPRATNHILVPTGPLEPELLPISNHQAFNTSASLWYYPLIFHVLPSLPFQPMARSIQIAAIDHLDLPQELGVQYVKWSIRHC